MTSFAFVCKFSIWRFTDEQASRRTHTGPAPGRGQQDHRPGPGRQQKMEGRHHFDKGEDIKRYTLSKKEIAAIKTFPRRLNEKVIEIVEGKKINAAMLHRRMPKIFSGSGVFTRIRKKYSFQKIRKKKGLKKMKKLHQM